jgi:hypothetical protein
MMQSCRVKWSRWPRDLGISPVILQLSSRQRKNARTLLKASRNKNELLSSTFMLVLNSLPRHKEPLFKTLRLIFQEARLDTLYLPAKVRNNVVLVVHVVHVVKIVSTKYMSFHCTRV